MAQHDITHTRPGSFRTVLANAEPGDEIIYHIGEEIAQGFRERYQALKAEDLSPDQIFTALQTFAGGMEGTPAHQAAVLAVMSYFFERCDIFEDQIGEDVGT